MVEQKIASFDYLEILTLQTSEFNCYLVLIIGSFDIKV